MRIEALTADLSPYQAMMAEARAAVTEDVVWYQYDILSNLLHMDTLLPEGYRDLTALTDGRPVADIGAADGDLAFTLERAAGWDMDIVDTAISNQNGLRGAALLKEQLGSGAGIHDINLDEQFRLPRDGYGLVLLLGILYHLQNPYLVLHELAKRSRYCMLSTRVARYAGPDGRDISDLPVGYLVGPTELNDDPTNYWVFSPAGLVQLAERSGWRVVSSMNAGDTVGSRPDSNEHDERMFMLLESTIVTG
jgi:hypothetical protein